MTKHIPDSSSPFSFKIAAFRAHLKNLRVERGFSQRVLAKRMGQHHSLIHQLEQGDRIPTLLTLFKLADALEIEPAELMEFQYLTDL